MSLQYIIAHIPPTLYVKSAKIYVVQYIHIHFITERKLKFEFGASFERVILVIFSSSFG